MQNSLNKTILLIEDEVAQRVPLVDMATAHGFKVIQANDGRKGLESALTEHPDIILLDLIMPEMNGIAFMKSLRGDEWGQTIPVIMLTNVSADTENTIQTIDQFHPSFYLTKADVTLEDIVQKVKEVLNIPLH